MKRYVVSGLIMLGLSMACEEKKKVRRVVAPKVQLTEVTSSPEINLPSVNVNTTAEEVAPVETKVDAKAFEHDVEPEKVALAAKTAPIQYEDVASQVIAEGSANEIKDEGLERIREKALARARELEAEEAAKDKATQVAVVETPAADVEPAKEVVKEIVKEEVLAPAVKTAVTKAQKIDLESKFQKALSYVKASKIEQAKNEFLSLCQAGHAHACHKFAWYEEQAGNKANASRFYQAACNNGLGKACNNLAFQFEQKKSYAEALALYARGCDEKHEASCSSLKRIRDEQAHRNR